MKCEFFIDNRETILDPDNVIFRHFKCSPAEYFGNEMMGFCCELDCVPSVGDGLDYNIFPEGTNATIVGVITSRNLCKDEENSEPYYSYSVKVIQVRDNG